MINDQKLALFNVEIACQAYGRRKAECATNPRVLRCNATFPRHIKREDFQLSGDDAYAGLAVLFSAATAGAKVTFATKRKPWP